MAEQSVGYIVARCAIVFVLVVFVIAFALWILVRPKWQKRRALRNSVMDTPETQPSHSHPHRRPLAASKGAGPDDISKPPPPYQASTGEKVWRDPNPTSMLNV